MKYLLFQFLLILILFNPAAAALVEADSLPVYELGTIVIYGEKTDDIRAASIQNIQARQIRQRDIRNIQDALAFSPGIYFSTTTKNESTFRLRGFEQRQISVFLDGIPISVPFDGVIDLSQFSGDNLENVRISRGNSSILYGANSLGGSVNIISNPAAEQTRLSLRSEASNFNRLFSNASVSTYFQKLYFNASFTYDKSGPFKISENAPKMLNQSNMTRDNSSYEKKSFSFKMRYEKNKAHQFGIQFHTVLNKYNVPPNASVFRPRYWRFPEWNKYVISLNSRNIITKDLMLRTILYFDNYVNRLQSFDDDSYSTQDMRYAFNSYYDDYSLGFALYPEFNLFNFGITEAVINYKQDVHREKAAASDPYQEFTAGSLVFGIEQNVNLSAKLQLLLGADLNYLQAIKAPETEPRDPILLYNGQIVFQTKYSAKITGHLSTGQKSRFPTLKELYSERLGRNIANPELQHETAWNTEAGIKMNFWGMNFQGAIFYNQLTNLIANKQLGDGIQQLQNIGKAEISGFEAAASYFTDNWILQSNFTFLRAVNLSKDRINTHLEYRPSARFNFFCEYKINKKMGVTLESSYTEGQFYQNPDSGIWESLNDFGLLNARFSYQMFEQFNVYLRANNLSDRFYFSEFGIPMAGRELIVGFRLNI